MKYDGNLRQRLIDQLNNAHDEMDEMDRAGLIDDGFNLAIAGEIPYSVALDMTEYMSKIDNMENSYFVWSVFSSRTRVYFLENLIHESYFSKSKKHLKILKKHLKILKKHLKILKTHLKILKKHLKILKKHLKILKKHLKILRKHLKILKKHLKI